MGQYQSKANIYPCQLYRRDNLIVAAANFTGSDLIISLTMVYNIISVITYR